MSQHRSRALAKRRRRRHARTLTVATVASVLVVAAGVVVEIKWSATPTNPTGAALAGITSSHSAALLEQERQQMIMVDSASKSVNMVGTPAVAQIQVQAPSQSNSSGSSGSGSGGSPPISFTPPDPGSAQAIAEQMLPSFGFSVSGQMGCLVDLWNRESGWNYRAENASGAYGIPQALPGDKMASAGSDWLTNPATQIKWGLGYIQDTYGTPCNAWGHEEADGWY